MNRPMHKRVFTLALAWTAIAVLATATAMAQDQTSAPASATTSATNPDAPATTAAAPAAAQRTDGQIEMDVVHALDASLALKSDLITAATIQGEVTLAGTVSSEASSELAEAIAGHVAGVTKVNNNLTVGNPQAAASANGQPKADSQPDNSDNAAAQPPPAMNDGPLPPGNPSQPVAPQPPARPQYVPARPPMQANDAPKAPVTIPEGTLLQVRTSEPVSSKRATEGTPIQFTVIRDVTFGGALAIPRGATAHGVVTEVKQAGALKGSPVLALKLTSLDLGGQNYPLDSDQFKVKGPGKGGQTAGNAVGGALLGAIIGGIADRGMGAAIGAGAGAAAGTAASAASSGPGVWIPAEALVDFHLNKPLTVTPVSAREASRLAQGLYPGGPSLYRRAYAPYGYPYGRPYPYGYAYPPVYFRPYYMVGGGFYYWR